MTDNIKSLKPVAWECASPEGERPALAFLTSKKPTVEHYENQGWRVTPLYAAPVADSAMAKDARFEALKRAGARMANTMFNMAQRTGEELDNQLCEKLAQMQKEWDAALSAIAASAEKQASTQ